MKKHFGNSNIVFYLCFIKLKKMTTNKIKTAREIKLTMKKFIVQEQDSRNNKTWYLETFLPFIGSPSLTGKKEDAKIYSDYEAAKRDALQVGRTATVIELTK